MSANRQGTPRRAPVATLPAHGAACPGEDNHSRFHGSLIPGYDASSKRALLTSKNTLSFALNLSNEPRPLQSFTNETKLAIGATLYEIEIRNTVIKPGA